MDQERIKRLKENEKLDEIIGEMANAYGQDFDRYNFHEYEDWIEYLEDHIRNLDAIADLIGLIGETLGIKTGYCLGMVRDNKENLWKELETVKSDWEANRRD